MRWTTPLCAWNYPRIESYGVRLPADYSGPIPAPLELMDVPEGEYMVFEHGPFDYEQGVPHGGEQGGDRYAGL